MATAALHTPKSLAPEQLAFYREHGYLTPFRAVGTDETAAMRASLDAFEAELKAAIGG